MFLFFFLSPTPHRGVSAAAVLVPPSVAAASLRGLHLPEREGGRTSAPRVVVVDSLAHSSWWSSEAVVDGRDDGDGGVDADHGRGGVLDVGRGEGVELGGKGEGFEAGGDVGGEGDPRGG